MAPAKKKKKDRGGKTDHTIVQRGATRNEQASKTDTASLPIEVQQKILDVFRRAFPFPHGLSDLQATIQEVKTHLFLRDFARAFAKPEYLVAYALRWSAGRALAYSSIFLHGELQQVWHGLSENIAATPAASRPDSSLSSTERFSHASACRLVCIGGGGGAEVAACAAAAREALVAISTGRPRRRYSKLVAMHRKA